MTRIGAVILTLMSSTVFAGGPFGSKANYVLSQMFSPSGDFRFPRHTSDPYSCTSIVAGNVYYNTTGNVTYVCNGTSWTSMVPPAVGADDTTLVSNGAAWQAKAIGDCDDTGGNHLNYDTGTNTFSCGTSNIAVGADDTTLVSSGAAWQAKAIADCDDSGGNHLNYDTATNALSCGTSAAPATTSLGCAMDGGGVAITTGVKCDVLVPYAATITEVTLLADVATDTVVDIWKDTYANYPPTDADSITAAAVPTIAAPALKNQDAVLNAWTKTIAAGETLRFNVDSNTAATRLIVTLKVTK